ncbi:MAG: PadR family transcriptional regulator [Coprobacillaceae bacterium]
MNIDEIESKYTPMTEPSCYILIAITKESRHGYAIMQYVKQITNNKITITNGTLYGILSRMETDGLISIVNKDDKKAYEITSLGLKILTNEKNRIKELLSNLERIL